MKENFLDPEFIATISNTVALLGGNSEIVTIIRKSNDSNREELIEKLKVYNVKLIDSAKDRL